MEHKFVFATENEHKLQEVKEIAGGKFDILSLNEINCIDKIPEDQNTLEGNALQKARFIYDKCKINCFADDTGLEVDVLNGEPGVYSARYAGVNCDFDDNIKKLLREMGDTPYRNARFRTIVALILDEKEYFFEGKINGEIISQKRGIRGFGYDAIFIPEGLTETFAELPSYIKNSISHRAIAMEKLFYFLRHYQK
ncbi:MAG: non-canonical purine NTP diphosphatase [Bacteroidales bacterium]|nr:non-canonical purine NTP diphosphatase [Bacteroidales bacterium]